MAIARIRGELEIVLLLRGIHGTVQDHVAQHFQFLLLNTNSLVVSSAHKVQIEGFVTGRLFPATHLGNFQVRVEMDAHGAARNRRD